MSFSYPPSPQILNWLSAGHLANRLHRTARWWVLLRLIYGETEQHGGELPEPFSYADLRDRLFQPSHSKNEKLPVEAVTVGCVETRCICQQSLSNLLFGQEFQIEANQWLRDMESLTGMNSEILRQEIAKAPFYTVHRSIRKDLSLLAKFQWLRAGERGLFIRQPEAKRPRPTSLSIKGGLEPSSQSRDLYWLLQEIAFLQPNLSSVINSLWEQHSTAKEWQATQTRTAQRLFLHLDFLSEEIAEQVEDHQARLEELWQQGDDRPIRFIYQLAQAKRQVKVLVYPVCLHYARRAKYLSAYGIDPYGQENWHNYRLDRICSDQLEVLDWQHPEIPEFLLKLKHQNQLPTPEEVREKLEEAWGLDFYRPAQLLILRFPADFAHWYVTEKFNRLKLEKLSYPQLVKRIRKDILDSQEQQTLLELVHQRQSSDSNNNYVYFCAQVRVGDINVTMRLRDWRPQGEVIAPLQLREQMKREALTELAHYQDGSN